MTYDGFNRYDFLREFNDARNASPLRERRVSGEIRDADDVPDEADA